MKNKTKRTGISTYITMMLAAAMIIVSMTGCGGEKITDFEETTSLDRAETVSVSEVQHNDQIMDPTITPIDKDKEWYWPVTHRYGMGSTKVGEGSDHIEILISGADPVYAACKGVIKETGSDVEWGQYLVLDAGEGITFKYGQLKPLYVDKGDTVEAGSILGKAVPGNGMITPRFNFAMYHNGEAIDPLIATDNWVYEEFEDIRLMLSAVRESLTDAYHEAGFPETTGIDIRSGNLSYDEQGGEISVRIRVDSRIKDNEELQTAEFKKMLPDFDNMVDELSEELKESLKRICSDTLNGRIDKERYRVKVEVVYEPWLPERIIEHLKVGENIATDILRYAGCKQVVKSYNI